MRSSLLHDEETLSLKSLEFNESGSVSRRRTIGPLDFSFESQGLRWNSRFLEKSGRARLTLSTHICATPQDLEYLEAVKALIGGAKTVGLHFAIQDQDVILFDHHPLSIPVTPVRLITALSVKIIACIPWINAFKETSTGTLSKDHR